jgi:hypothetical protein
MPKQPNSAPGKKPAALNAAHGDCLAKLWCGPGPRPKGEITAKGRGRAWPGMKNGHTHCQHQQETGLGAWQNPGAKVTNKPERRGLGTAAEDRQRRA